MRPPSAHVLTLAGRASIGCVSGIGIGNRIIFTADYTFLTSSLEYSQGSNDTTFVVVNSSLVNP